MNQVKLLLITIIGLWSFCGLAEAKVVNCYYGTWAHYRTGNGKFDVSNIDPSLCTHVSYTFFGIDDTGAFKVLDTWLAENLGQIAQTIALKQSNPNLKVIATVGGWNEGSTKYSSMAGDVNKRQLFISSTLSFIRQYGFDGLTLDWEYPAQNGGSPQDKANYVTLLQELKAALGNLELSVAVGASASIATVSYDIPNIAATVDYIHVMTYDFATSADGVLGFNAPLVGQGQNNVESSIQYWLQAGAPASKLVLGLAFYGRSFQLSNSQQTSVGSPSSGAGTAGPYTQEAGYLGYNEICTLISSYTYNWANDYDVPYIYNSNQWIGYDNVQSIGMKVDYLNSLKLAGALVWSIETDDFLGTCGDKYPLLNAINNKLGNQQGGGGGGDQTAPETTTTTTQAPSIPENGNCSTDGFFGDATDCTRYYQCANGVRYNFQCSTGLNFDVATKSCNWPNVAQCQT